MDVKEAIAKAKTYVGELFAEDGISDVRLEEVEHDESDRSWNVTLGFLRHREASTASFSELATTLNALAARRRVYRVVRVREADGAIMSVKHRDLAADAA